MLRDHFIEGLQDSGLKRELRKFVRAKLDSTLIAVREEASLWVKEEVKSLNKVVRCRSKGSDGLANEAWCTVVNMKQPPTLGLEDLCKVVAEQGKQISELTGAVKMPVMHQTSVSNKGNTKPRTPLKFTEAGKPIYLKCQGEGHS